MNDSTEKSTLDGNAVIYCDGAFNTTYGKTAHGLIRYTHRYKILGVIDSRHAGEDAGRVLDAQANGIRIYGSLDDVMLDHAGRLTHFVIGLAPDGGRLDPSVRKQVAKALAAGLDVDSGLHAFISEDAELVSIAQDNGAVIRDVRMPPARDQLHFFSGHIEQVKALKVAVLGTDSAVGKRTTAWLMVQGLQACGISAEMIGTGQTAWLQGARYGVVMDALVNDFVSGEIEHAICSAWEEVRPQVLVLEGQGSLLNPAYPGGFELLAAGRPDIVVLQHAPARREYDGFPGYTIQPLSRQIEAIELICGKPVVAVCLNHEDLSDEQIPELCSAIEMVTGLPTVDVLKDGADRLQEIITGRLEGRE